MEKKDEQTSKNIERIVKTEAMRKTIQKYGEAAKQHYVAYSGMDNENGKVLAKGLKDIAKEKINPEYKFSNIHEQAGFSAEVKEVAKSNSKAIISGKPNRKIRTDDLGRVNDQLVDVVTVDKSGKVIKGSEIQMKFLGASQNDPSGTGDVKRALSKLQSTKYEKYINNDIKIGVPSDQYDGMLKEADSRIDKLIKQMDNQKKAGKIEETELLQKKIENLKKIKQNLYKTDVSSKEAVFARLHPKLSTAVEVSKISLKAGLQTAGTSAMLTGGISIVRNLVSMCKGEIEPKDAVENVAKETGGSAIGGYAMGGISTAITGAMKNAKSQYMREIATTNIAAEMITITSVVGQTLKRYFKGEIDGVECMESLGEQGTGMVSSAMFSAIGQIVIPIPVVGGLIGGMLGYSIASASYGILTQSLKEQKAAHEQRIEIEHACGEYIKLMNQYRDEVEKTVSQYLQESMSLFRESFDGIKNAFVMGDADWFIENTNTIAENFGGKAKFSSMEEFNLLMENKHTFQL